MQIRTRIHRAWVPFIGRVVLLLLAASCGRDRRAQLFVTVDTDLRDLRSVRIVIAREPLAAGEVPVASTTVDVVARNPTWPLIQDVVPEGEADRRPFRVSVTADGENPTLAFTLQVVVPVAPHQIVRVPLFLAQACRAASARAACEAQGRLCGAGGTCVVPTAESIDPANATATVLPDAATLAPRTDDGGPSGDAPADGAVGDTADAPDTADARDAAIAPDTTDATDAMAFSDADATMDTRADSADEPEAAPDARDAQAMDTLDAFDGATVPDSSTQETAVGADAVADVRTDTVEACVPACAGRSCGPDGCGGTCGSGCALAETCNLAGQCITLCPGTMVYVPGGTLQMGAAASDTAATSAERPVHAVTLSAFCMDRTEVTVGAMRASGLRAGADACSWTQNAGSREQQPLNCVSWDAADTYCRQQGGRLPTEAEWERAARGSGDRRYPWGDGNGTCALAVFGGCPASPGPTLPVGSTPTGRSPFGVQDLAGNVAEWVRDWYAASFYQAPGATAADPTGPATGTLRVVRGGSWADTDTTGIRSTRRDPRDPTLTTLDDVGFRCVRATCTPDCTGRTCGDDGCGGQCGATCASGETCSAAGRCVRAVCPPGSALIPAGTMRMGGRAGDPDLAVSAMSPRHVVRVSAFCMDVTEVTVAAYLDCTQRAQNGVQCTTDGLACHASEQTFGTAGRSNFAVNCVSWNQATEFCRWRGGTLPTEAQWEYAARGTTDNRFPWGDTADCTRGSWAPCPGAFLTEVGQYPLGASPFGILDMAGNVYEWVADFHGAYSPEPAVDPVGPATGTDRVIRGNFWYNGPGTSAFRRPENPGTHGPYVGIRCARPVCIPSCGGRTCGSDGCGGSCGSDC